MITVAIFVFFAVVWAVLTRWWGNLKFFQGYIQGVSDGADFFESEVQPYLPWNASGEWLSEWADARLAEEALSDEAEDFLKLKYDDA